jgi:hypothetical protein
LHRIDGRRKITAVRSLADRGSGVTVTRVALVVAVAFGVLAAPVTGGAPQAKNIPRLCFLTFDPGTAQFRWA